MNPQIALAHKVKFIELATKEIVNSLFSGMYASIFKGRGIELEELREFQEGDDIRAVSWSKTASMGKPFVKTFKEERDLQVMLLVDISHSMDLGSHYERKKQIVAEIGATITLSAIKNHDRVGLILFSDHVEKCIMPKRGTRHSTRIIRELVAYKPTSRKTNLQVPLQYFYRISPKRTICFIISDFIGPAFDKELLLVAKKNDMIGIRVLDQIDINIPPLGIAYIQDIETDEQLCVEISKKIAERYKFSVQELMDGVSNTFRKSGAGLINIYTSTPFVDALKTYFAKRKKRHR
jgi:uncharacterized protein (DUF58 family)